MTRDLHLASKNGLAGACVDGMRQGIVLNSVLIRCFILTRRATPITWNWVAVKVPSSVIIMKVYGPP